MSLNWSISNVKNKQEIIDDKSEQSITTAICFATMPIGISNITEANIDKFATRMNMWQAVIGPLMNKWVGDDLVPTRVTYADLHRRIGLTTNASARTEPQFRKMIADELSSTAHREMLKERNAMVERETA